VAVTRGIGARVCQIGRESGSAAAVTEPQA
jgi:hypothetical protein